MNIWKAATKIYDDIFEVNPLSTPTWLAIGATLQVIIMAFLPKNISMLIPISYLTYRLMKAVIDSRNLYTNSFTTVKRGTWIAELPGPQGDRKEDGSLVMFIIGARINHPLGPLGLAGGDAGDPLEPMWVEAEANREKWGFLGRTPVLTDTSDTEGMTMIWLTYWKNLHLLNEFATSKAHRSGQVNYEKGKFPHLGIFHEAYHAPKGCWEAIYDDMPPWGLGKIGERLKTLRPRGAPGQAHMLSRMERNARIAEGEMAVA